MKKGSTPILQSKTKLVTCQLLLLVAIFLFWWLMTKPGLIPPFMFQDENQAAFFFGEPVQIGKVIWDWFAVNLEIYPNLAVTLTETVLAFIFGTAAGLLVGLWLALAPTAAAIADPYIKGLNSMPRVSTATTAFSVARSGLISISLISVANRSKVDKRTIISANLSSFTPFWPRVPWMIL